MRDGDPELVCVKLSEAPFQVDKASLQNFSELPEMGIVAPQPALPDPINGRCGRLSSVPGDVFASFGWW